MLFRDIPQHLPMSFCLFPQFFEARILWLASPHNKGHCIDFVFEGLKVLLSPFCPLLFRFWLLPDLFRREDKVGGNICDWDVDVNVLF